MPTSDPRGEHGRPVHSGDRLPAVAGRAARDRDRLRASEAEVASEVIEFQLARQRVGLRAIEEIEPLTSRELEVLGLLGAGRTDAEIADELFISKKTASVHVANIKAKIGASSRVEIALIAARIGLVDPAAPAAASRVRSADPGSRVVCPFKGLASFEVRDAPYFFGRERTVAELVARLAGSTFMGVVGSSGSGKSSVVRAGLIPALADGVLPGSEHWAVALLRPGPLPSTELDRAVTSALEPDGRATGRTIGDLLERLPGGARLLVVVDQFEELFTVCSDDEERAAFIRSIVSLARDPASRALMVVAVRADFYGRCAEDRGLAELLGSNHVLVGPMSADELARAVELPARAARLRVEPELTSSLVADVAGAPGGLPLLSTTLLDLWERRDGRWLRLATYEQIGGVSGAVSRLAERAFARLSEDQQEIARSILLRMATPSEESDAVTRRPAPYGELGVDRRPDVAEVLRVLTESRLLTVSDGWVEIAHEALLREWPRLRGWLDDDTQGRRVRAHLVRAAREWEQAGDDPAELYRGARLAAALDWAEGRDLEMNELERRFLDASRTAGEREGDRQRQANRRLRTLLGGAVAFLVLALIAGTFAAIQLGRAEQEAARAEQEAARAEQEASAAREARDLARAQGLAASAITALEDDPALAKLLALTAVSATGDPPPGVVGVLHEAWAGDRVVRRYTWPADQETGAVTDLHPAGDLVVATAGFFAPGPLEVVDIEAGLPLWSFDPPAGAAVGSAFFTPDGERVVAGVYQRPDADAAPRADVGVRVWDAQTGAILDEIDLGPCGARVTAVARDGVLVQTAAGASCPDPSQGTAPLGYLDIETRVHRVIAEHVPMSPERSALTPDGRFVAYDDLAGAPRAIVHDLRTGETVLEIDLTVPHGQDFSYARALSDDGSMLVFGDLPVQVRDVAGGEVLAAFGGETGAIGNVEFAPDGTLFTTGRDAAVRQWDPRSGRSIFAVPAVGSGQPSVSVDGLVLVSSPATNTAVLLDPRVRGELGAVDARAQGEYWEGAGQAGECFVLADSLTAGGGYLVFLDGCGGGLAETTTQVVPIDGKELRHSLPGNAGQSVAISPDGTRFARQEATGLEVGPITIRDLATGDVIRELDGTCSYENAFDTAEFVGQCLSFPDAPFPVWAYQLRWSPDGSMLAAVDQANGGFVAVWNVEDGSLITRERLNPDPPDAASNVIFTPDSERVIVAYYGGGLEAFSVRTGTLLAAAAVDTAYGIGFFGFSPDGRTLYALSGYQGGGSGALHWLDAQTLQESRPAREQIHEASPKSIAMSEDGSLLATGASDGFVRVWAAASGDLVHEISFGPTEIQGVAFTPSITSRWRHGSRARCCTSRSIRRGCSTSCGHP